MYLSNRDIRWAIECGKLIVDPRPEACVPPKGYDETGIDLHLGPIDTAKIWDLGSLSANDAGRGAARAGQPPEVHLGTFDYRLMAAGHLRPVPEGEDDGEGKPRLVYWRGGEMIVRQLGFLLWSTRERVGTPEIDPASLATQRHPELICFVNAKSTRARTGLIVHFTAPTIHAGWTGNVTVEISNLGPFTLILKEGDALAQLTVATISSAPDMELKIGRSQTQGQADPSGAPG
jgi:deoxycytidine triphosphate deaminase